MALPFIDGPIEAVEEAADPEGPNSRLAFEITPPEKRWSFTPEFYPEEFTQMKKRELSRYGGACGGESVSIKSVKNREFHANGMMLRSDISLFQRLIDHDGVVDLISPLTPNGGMECYVKKGEIGSQKGWDPYTDQRIFDYTLDFVSTGHDEFNSGRNKIVTGITGFEPTDNLQENNVEPDDELTPGEERGKKQFFSYYYGWEDNG